MKYLSEIITARVEEIIQAMLYEISESGLAEHLRSGIVITGGASQTANLGMLIRQMSGYNVRIGHPLGTLSCQDIEGICETTATTSVGLIQAAIEDECMNCAICDETYHTEIETPVEEPVPVEITEDEIPEAYEPEYVEEVEADEEEPEEDPDEEEDEDFDEELEEEEDDDDDSPVKKTKKNRKGGFVDRIRFIWNKINDDTDTMIDDMTK